MDITSAQYIKNMYDEENISIKVTIDDETMFVPLDPANRHYAAILKWAEEDGNEIQAAE